MYRGVNIRDIASIYPSYYDMYPKEYDRESKKKFLNNKFGRKDKGNRNENKV